MITCHKEMSCHGHVTFATPTGECVAVLIRLPASLWTRDQSIPVALTFDNKGVVTRTLLSIGALRTPPRGRGIVVPHSIYVGLTTPFKGGTTRRVAHHSPTAKPRPTSTMHIGTLVVPHPLPLF
jgi:hypothetical protein